MTTDAHNNARYAAVPAQIDLPSMEHDILRYWAENDTFAQSLKQTSEGEPWTFYEGPPTANGKPGTHHIEARVFKDVFPRFRTMQGRHVERRAGWDCHGLPVELAVEKELGINGKPQIEEYGVEAFNAKCRESVQRHVDAFSELTDRMGYWVNMDQAYWTMNPSYVESVWWALKQIFDRGLLGEDYRVAPYCPRCGTGLSDHELAQGYEDVVDPSIYVRFALTSGPWAGRSMLVWTTTPWTVVSNTAVAAHPEVTYVAVTDGNEELVVAEELVDKALGDGWEVIDRIQGREMEKWTYDRPLDLLGFDEPAHFVVLADYVTTTDGTGLVHQAPAFGADDMVVCRAYGLPMMNPVRADGTFEESVPLVGGVFFKDADPTLIEEMERRGVLYRALDYPHAYPHCWRCHTALLYYAQPSWYVRTTRVKDALIRENEATTWHPENVKHGRYGDWLDNNIDWALSRKRYWGTPLPIWRNDENPDDLVCVGSLAELSELTGRDLSGLDPHRPFIDEVSFTKDGVSGTYRRVPEVIDAWFDSGSMPFAQLGYPHVPGSKEAFADAYPADFICEAIDQTRGWFYSLMAVGTTVFDQSSYRNVVCLGHILAEDGRKMSKHLGNILEPIPLMDRHGADAVRWFMACSGSPWMARRVGDGTLNETVRKVLLTFWNTVAFHALYANANDWTPTGSAPQERHVLDRWLQSTTQGLIEQVTEALENYETQRYGQLISEFVDDLSNWYVRRSRRRFWEGEESALWTLHETLHVLVRLMAPVTPFITERVWQDLFASDPEQPASVHLASWPQADASLRDLELEKAMTLTERLVLLGRAARAEAKVKVRQPLAQALVPSAAFAHLTEELQAEIRAELNVEKIGSFAGAGDLVDYSAKGNFRNLGKRFAKQTPLVAQAIADADAADLAAALKDGGTARVACPEVDADGVEVSADDVIISERPREGWSVINDQGETIALDLELTPELERAGLVREVIRFVQDSRKNAGFEVSDRICLTWVASGDLADAIGEHAEQIAGEVLATSMDRAEESGQSGSGDGWFTEQDLGLAVHLTRN